MTSVHSLRFCSLVRKSVLAYRMPRLAASRRSFQSAHRPVLTDLRQTPVRWQLTDGLRAFLVIKFRRESDSPTLRLGWHHQTTNCVKDHLELAVVSILQLR